MKRHISLVCLIGTCGISAFSSEPEASFLVPISITVTNSSSTSIQITNVMSYTAKTGNTSGICNNYNLYCNTHALSEEKPSLRSELLTQRNGRNQKDIVLGMPIYVEKHLRKMSTDPRDQFDPRQNNLRQISADRIKLSENSRTYFSQDDGLGYEITKNVDISVKSNGAKIQLSF